MDLFHTNIQLYKKLINGLDLCVCGLLWLSAVWILILRAPIHCRGSVQNLFQWRSTPSSSSTTKCFNEKAHLQLGWPEGQYIFGWTIPSFWLKYLQAVIGPRRKLHPHRLTSVLLKVGQTCGWISLWTHDLLLCGLMTLDLMTLWDWQRYLIAKWMLYFDFMCII